jgi:uncharacterized protein YaaN involved in tellurite resistance
MSDAEQREKAKADAIAQFGAEEYERLSKFAATLLRKSKEQPTGENVKAVKTDIMYSLKAGQDYLWID